MKYNQKIILKDGKFLMAGNDRDDYLYSVGGRLQFGETAEEAVVREVEEETGRRLEVDRLGFVHENYFYGDVPGVNAGKLVYEVSLFFYMKAPDGFEPVGETPPDSPAGNWRLAPGASYDTRGTVWALCIGGSGGYEGWNRQLKEFGE